MIRALHTFDIGEEFAQMRSVPVAMGPGKEGAVLFIHSKHPGNGRGRSIPATNP